MTCNHERQACRLGCQFIVETCFPGQKRISTCLNRLREHASPGTTHYCYTANG